MKNLLQGLLVAASLLIASAFPVKADGIFNPGSSSGGGTGNICGTGPCFFLGADGTKQFETGATNSAANWLDAIGAIAGTGPSIIAQGSDTNIPINFTAKGTGADNFSNGSGVLATFADPGAAVTGTITSTPGISSGPANISAPNGINWNGLPLISDFPGYIVSNWYLAYGPSVLGSGTAPGTGSIRCYPAYIKQKITINTLGLRITTVQAAGNVQAAIYANNPATGKATGTPLVSTGSMSTTSLANVTATISTQFPAALYQFCTNSDNATSAYSSYTVAGAYVGALIGSTNQTNDLASQTLIGASTAQTFGTWPDLTSATWADVTSNLTMPALQFKVGSVP